MSGHDNKPVQLDPGATVAIVGGGPAGAFTAIHLLRQAQARGHQLRVVIFERRRSSADGKPPVASGTYTGCPQCAGGISPRLNDAMSALSLPIPTEVIQARISSITIQGNWKHISLPVPDKREMLSVYRGALPFGQHEPHACFDSMLLDAATDRGAELTTARVTGVYYDSDGMPILRFQESGDEKELSAALVVFAGGVNETRQRSKASATPIELFQALQPAYRPPTLRKAMIFELEAPGGCSKALEGDMHFIESSSGELQLDMCSIIPKRDYFTVTVIGKSVDSAHSHEEVRELIHQFLRLPQIRRTLPPDTRLKVRCICSPSIVVGTADSPVADRAVAVGDMATSRHYKDGILSAHTTAEDVARIVFEQGVDFKSLQQGYGATMARFRHDNRFATLIFALYRWFFTSPFWSRVIYQTYASELKSTPRSKRSFERIFWAISSGDDSYEKIAWSMLKPSALWKIFSGGLYVTLRNAAGEHFFGLDWSGIGRFPTAVSREQLRAERVRLTNSHRCEFECIYTIRLRTQPANALALLGKFGESDRPYLTPRWVKIQRIKGEPLEPGCVIDYHIMGGLIHFSIEQLATANPYQVRYRVRDGFANGGIFIFEIEPSGAELCSLTVYLTFDYARGKGFVKRVYWHLFRLSFPEFIHEVLWNHALCQFKQLVESIDLESAAQLIELKQV